MDEQADLAGSRSVEAAQRYVEGDRPGGHKFLLCSTAVPKGVVLGLS
jgi:hypothetical protein